jgi:hypothetical protein
MDAGNTVGALYVVHFWVRPDGGQAVIDWLDHRHMAEVAEQPGFLWAKRCRLEQDAADGWQAHMMVYGLASRAVLEAYFQSDARRRFMTEGSAFQHLMRAERLWGTVEAGAG